MDSEHIAAGAVDTEHLADLNVTTAKLNDSAVTTAKLDNNAVTSAKLADDIAVDTLTFSANDSSGTPQSAMTISHSLDGSTGEKSASIQIGADDTSGTWKIYVEDSGSSGETKLVFAYYDANTSGYVEHAAFDMASE